MKIKINSNDKADKTLAIRMTTAEYDLLASKAAASRVKISTLARIVLVQVLKAGIEVN